MTRPFKFKICARSGRRKPRSLQLWLMIMCKCKCKCAFERRGHANKRGAGEGRDDREKQSVTGLCLDKTGKVIEKRRLILFRLDSGKSSLRVPLAFVDTPSIDPYLQLKLEKNTSSPDIDRHSFALQTLLQGRLTVRLYVVNTRTH